MHDSAIIEHDSLDYRELFHNIYEFILRFLAVLHNKSNKVSGTVNESGKDNYAVSIRQKQEQARYFPYIKKAGTDSPFLPPI